MLSFLSSKKPSKYSLEKIGNIINNYNIPTCQRSILKNRVDVLNDNILIKFNPITPIYFCMYKNKRYVIDGQHRLECYKNNKHLINSQIPIIDIFVDNKNDIYEYFKIINDNMTLNDIWIEKNQEKKSIITDTYNHFNNKYPNTFKYKGRKRPYMDSNKFLTQITEILDNNNTKSIKNSIDLIDILENLNNKYSKKDNDWFPSKGNVKNSNIIETLKKNNCLYFGLLPNIWINHINCINDLPQNNEEDKISVAFRQNIWYKYSSELKKLCLCCNHNEISAFNFECGHIISKKMGGKISNDNIVPICSLCNKSMGSTHMFQFMEKMNYPKLFI